MQESLFLPRFYPNLENKILSQSVFYKILKLFSRSFIPREIDSRFVFIWKSEHQKLLANAVLPPTLFIWLLKPKMKFQEFIQDHMVKQCYWSMEKDISTILFETSSSGGSLTPTESYSTRELPFILKVPTIVYTLKPTGYSNYVIVT